MRAAPTSSARRSRRSRQRGFTLLEIMAATIIFAGIAVIALATMADAAYLTTRARTARELRLLAEYKLGEVLVFEEEFDQSALSQGDFRELGDRYAAWKWRLDLRDVTVFGVAAGKDAEYLFEAPSEEEQQQTPPPTGAPPGAAAKQGEMQALRELVLTVTADSEDGQPDSIEIVLYAPLAKAAAAAAAGPPGGQQ
jgi:prepilin-type N-terminal cleavage/methylation domain-containing protein